MLRRIGTWLRAGGLEAGELRSPATGTPQGSVASPLLANVFRHHVLDAGCVNEVQPRLQGRCCWTRFAEDFSSGFAWEAAARRVMAGLPKRFDRCNRAMHPAKTALMACTKPRRQELSAKGTGTFDSLGLTHDWSKTHRGYWAVQRKTVGKRVRRFMNGRWTGCRANRHDPLSEQ
jgi:RNA-directed DNA polymerase